MKHLYLAWATLTLSAVAFTSQAQTTTGGVRIGTAGAPNASAVLDLSPDAANAPKGLLPPRVTLAQRNNISSPATGLVVYQTDNTPGLYLYNGAAWVLQGDNLGNHTATQNLNLQANALTGTGSSLSGVGVGVRADGGLNLGQNTFGNNLFLGFRAGGSNTTGVYNLFSGYQAGRDNTTGGYNVFSGYQAGLLNNTGNQNVFTGLQSGYSNTAGSDNTFNGYASGNANNTGNYNVFNGSRSGFRNTSGSYNTAVGYNSGPDIGSGGLTNATALGANVVLKQSNTVVLGNNANVGIGTSVPNQLLEVGGQDAPTLLLHSSGNNLVDGATLQFRENDLGYGWNLRHNSGGSENGSTDDRLVLENTNGGTASPVMTWNQGSGNVSIANDLNVSGNVGLNYYQNFGDLTLPGNSRGSFTISCPAGYRLLSGGGGHRDYNPAQTDITVNYSGPDNSNPSQVWSVLANNSSSSSRTIRIWCTCAKVQ